MKEIKEEADRLVELHANECPKGYGWCANRFGLKHAIIDVSNTIEVLNTLQEYDYITSEKIVGRIMFKKQVKAELESR